MIRTLPAGAEDVSETQETWDRVQALEGSEETLATKPAKARTGLRHTQRRR